MKKLIILITFLFLVSCSDDLFGPETAANIELSGILTYDYTSYSAPRIKGQVINNGDATGYNISVTFTALNNNTIIDTAVGFPADLGDIKPGQKAMFEAIFFKLVSHNQYNSKDIEIDFLTKD